MSKSRFRGRSSVLNPEWILAGTESRSAASTATVDNGTLSNSASSIEQDRFMARSNDEPGQNPHLLDSTHETENTTTILVNGGSSPAKKKSKSRYSKLHTATWIMSSTEDDAQLRKDTRQQATSKLKSWTQRLMGEIKSQDKMGNMPSSGPTVPPAPTRRNFEKESLPRHLRRQNRRNHASPQSSSSHADAPPKAPSIASNYTSPCSPAYSSTTG